MFDGFFLTLDQEDFFLSDEHAELPTILMAKCEQVKSAAGFVTLLQLAKASTDLQVDKNSN